MFGKAILGCGLTAAILVNYWVLAPILGVDHDPGFSWISDLAARGEEGNWRFALLNGLSGVAVICFGALLWPALGRRDGLGASALRWGLILLIASGALAIADALMPVSCARSLGEGCVRAGDLVDDLHELESALPVLVTGGAMILIGLGLRKGGGPRWLASAGLSAGVAFLVMSGLISMREVVDAFNECKGWLQRGGQVVFGCWLAAMAFAADGRKLRP